MKSIRTQLTFIYSLSAFILLAIVALLFYWGMINLLYKADYQFLVDEVDTIQYIMENKSVDIPALRKEVIEIPSEHNTSIYRYYIRLFDENKQVIMQTPNMDSVIPVTKSYSSMSKVLGKKTYTRYSNHIDNYLLIHAPINFANHKIGMIEIALNISYQHNIIDDRGNLFLLLLLGALIAFTFGLVVARKGLQSLLMLTHTTQKITSASLHQRLDPKSWPKELSALGEGFNQMLDRIEASFLRLKQLSSDLAHELRTPVNILIGETEVALSYAHSVTDYRQAMESNLEELQRLSHLIENMLFLAHAENPKIDLQKERMDVQTEISKICAYHQPMADEKNIQLVVEGNANLPANVVMFRRLINNLLSNALKYSNTGTICFLIQELNHQVQITLSDQGPGVAAEHLPKLFDRFYRTDSARSHPDGGLGLGLAIVKSIVDLHQGTISIMSEQNIGTTVTLTLPK